MHPTEHLELLKLRTLEPITPENVTRYIPGTILAVHYVQALGHAWRTRNGGTVEVVDVALAYRTHMQSTPPMASSDDEDASDQDF